MKFLEIYICRLPGDNLNTIMSTRSDLKLKRDTKLLSREYDKETEWHARLAWRNASNGKKAVRHNIVLAVIRSGASRISNLALGDLQV